MISISILNIKDDYDKIKQIDSLGTDYIHMDIMDGEFVSNKVDIDIDTPKTKRDVHLMVYDVYKYIDEYIKYEPEYITFHYEINEDIMNVINYIKSKNIKVGLSIKPNTEVKEIEEYLKYLDLVLVMSVEPGRGGQAFMMDSVDKINELKRLRDLNNYDYKIEVDGGINNETSILCNNADILVVGSYITMSDNYEESLKNIA